MSSNGDGDKETAASTNDETPQTKKMKYNTPSNEEWVQKWTDNKIGFHNETVHPLLVKHFDKLLNGRENISVFIPLCGKSLDMKWLYDNGHSVIGIEVAERGIEEFFNENGLEFIKQDLPKINGSLFKTKDEKIKIYHCDVFAFDRSLEEEIGGIWDRGSFVAINREDRSKYVDVMKSFISTDTTYLLVTLDFDETIHAGPPQFVAEEVITDFYGKDYNVKQIDYKDALKDRHRKWGLSSFHERLHLITSKK